MYYDVLFHVDTDVAMFTMALRNAGNYIDALGDQSYSVAIVVNGNAIELLKRADCANAELISRLAVRGVSFYACQNAMREHEIRQDELISEAIIVPAGVVHLVKLQREGFAYIKP